MKLAAVLAAAALAGSVAILPLVSFPEASAQEEGKKEKRRKKKDGEKKEAEKPAPGAVDPAMEAWMKAATPGEAHKVLEDMVGEWETVLSTRMAPEAPPIETKGTCKRSWVLGKRFVEEKFSGELMGPFEGHGFTGYDNIDKKYVSIWMDNMMTGVLQSTGTYDPAKKVFTFTGVMKEVTGESKKYRNTIKIEGKDRQVFEMHAIEPDGKETQAVKVTYTRKK